MKTKDKWFAFHFSLCIFLTGCAKVDTTRINTTGNSAQQTTIATDEVTVNDELDQVIDEAMQVCTNHNVQIMNTLIDSSRIDTGLIFMYYYGKEADGTKARTGGIEIQLNLAGGKVIPWASKGASATLIFGTVERPGYEVMFTSNNTSLRLYGSATFTNVTGGALQNLSPGDSLVEKLNSSDFSFTYNDNAAVIVLFTWSVNNLRVFKSSDSVVTATTFADTSINGISHVVTWGVNRFNQTFYTSLTSPLIQNISAASLSYNPLSGAKAIEDIPEPILSTYGVNQQGAPVNTGAPYGFSISWVNNGGQASAVIGYYY